MLEDITRKTRGLIQIGHLSDPIVPFDRTTGNGYVAHFDGHYADAIAKKNPRHPLGMRDLGRHLTRRACGTRPPGPPGPQARPPRRNGLRDQPRRAKRPEGLPCTPHRTDLFCCRIRRRRMSVGVWRRHHGRLMRPPV